MGKVACRRQVGWGWSHLLERRPLRGSYAGAWKTNPQTKNAPSHRPDYGTPALVNWPVAKARVAAAPKTLLRAWASA